MFFFYFLFFSKNLMKFTYIMQVFKRMILIKKNVRIIQAAFIQEHTKDSIFCGLTHEISMYDSLTEYHFKFKFLRKQSFG